MRLYLMPLPALVMAAGLAVFGITSGRVRRVSRFPPPGQGRGAPRADGGPAGHVLALPVHRERHDLVRLRRPERHGPDLRHRRLSKSTYIVPARPVETRKGEGSRRLLTRGQIVSLAFVAIAFIRNVLSMVGVFGLGPWRESMSVPNMFIVMAIVSLAINLLTLPLVIWGKRARIATAARYKRLAAAPG